MTSLGPGSADTVYPRYLKLQFPSLLTTKYLSTMAHLHKCNFMWYEHFYQVSV